VPADIVSIRVRLTTGKRFVNITCAVVEKLNYSLILGSDIVDKLNQKFIDKNFDASEVMNVVNYENDDNCDRENDENENMSDPHRASAEILISEQKSDRSLIHCWSLAERQRAGYYVRDGILYRNYKYLGQNYEQLVLPVNRRQEVIKLAHEIYSGHLNAKKTKERIKLSFTWPIITSDVQRACESCHQCQRKRQVAVCDRVSVIPIKKDKVTGSTVQVDFQDRENSELSQDKVNTQDYAMTHTDKAQRYILRYNLQAKEKSFETGQKVLVLTLNSTSSKTFSRWVGPAVIKDRMSNHTYLVDINGARKHIHADKLRKYHIQDNEVICDTVTTGHEQTRVNHCAVIYDDDSDFGSVDVIDTDQYQQPELLPSQRIDLNSLSHLTVEQRTKLFALLDKYSEYFSEKAGLCTVLQHEINVSADFKPKRLRAYRVPEKLKPMVDLLKLGIIKPSKSEMGSPIVCVLKGNDGKDGIRIAIDYRYLNKYCEGDAYPMPEISDLTQKVGQAKFISLCDIKSAYHQIEVKPEHQWLTAFVWDGGLYQ